MIVPPSGPPKARIMIVGEAPGEQEVLRREPFVGASGMELTKMLHEAQIVRSECFITNVARERPSNNDISTWFVQAKKQPGPDWLPAKGGWMTRQVADGLEQLKKEIELVEPNVIIAFGNLALWALAGRWGITDWRGSNLPCTLVEGPRVIPTYHPAAVLRQWSWRAIAVADLRRAARQANSREYSAPAYRFHVRPSADAVLARLADLEAQANAGPLKLSVDIETRIGHIACIGIAWSKLDALCIPLMCTENIDGYWPCEIEAAIVYQLSRLLTHPNVQVIGQNFLYDAQYIWRHWRFIPAFSRDTMIGHHTLFAGMPKGLDFLSSMYCEHHVYWKSESKEWHKDLGEEQLWIYNCKDCVITYEVDEEICAAAEKLGLVDQMAFQNALFWPTLQAMIEGVRVDAKRRSDFALELSQEIAAREERFIHLLGHPLNPRSAPQMKRLFYEDLGQKPIFNRKTGAVTLNDEALEKIAVREPLLRPLVRTISEYRSLGVFLSTFVNASLDRDGRLRSSFNPAGTETFRYSSSENAFGSGLNFQNIPKGGATAKDDPNALQLPNVRKLFVPEPGFTFFDMDLDRADLQVVVWEAEDKELKQALHEGVDIHQLNADTLGISRQLAKSWVHGTNYGGGPRTMAATCGITVHQAERMQSRWFQAHPGIKRWHDRVLGLVNSTRTVTNRFGYRRIYFDRIEGILPEALAWIPQSTVACVINRIWENIACNLPEVRVLLQVHDSLAGQFPTHLSDWCIARMRERAQVVVPYEDPLIIPVGIKTSTLSWGDVK